MLRPPARRDCTIVHFAALHEPRLLVVFIQFYAEPWLIISWSELLDFSSSGKLIQVSDSVLKIRRMAGRRSGCISAGRTAHGWTAVKRGRKCTLGQVRCLAYMAAVPIYAKETLTAALAVPLRRIRQFENQPNVVIRCHLRTKNERRAGR